LREPVAAQVAQPPLDAVAQYGVAHRTADHEPDPRRPESGGIGDRLVGGRLVGGRLVGGRLAKREQVKDEETTAAATSCARDAT
jgi:hypothetical protein